MKKNKKKPTEKGKPRVKSESLKRRKPNKSSESLSKRKPPVNNEPLNTRKPVRKGESRGSRNPKPNSESTRKSNPSPINESLKICKPNTKNESLTNRKPMIPSESNKPSKPVKVSEPITPATLKQELGKIVAGSFYDHQEVRITETNRIRDIIRRRIEGIPIVNVVEDKKEEDEKYKEEYTDKDIWKFYEELKAEGKISAKEVEYIEKIREVQKNAEKYELLYKNLMAEFIETEPIYVEFLNHIRGISIILSSNLIKEFGYCEKAPHISSLWKYCGMHVVEGEAPKRKKGQKLDFSIKLRTMVWKISDSFIKQRTPFYRDIYDKEKARQLAMMKESQARQEDQIVTNQITKENHSNKVSQYKQEDQIKIASHKQEENQMIIANPPKSLLHADLRARRKMVKIFLAHYWMASQDLNPASHEATENHLTKASQPYVQAYLRHKHISSWKEAVAANDFDKINRANNKVKKEKIKYD